MDQPVSIALSATVLSEADSAKKTACASYIKSYNAQTATVQEMREYASCVHRVYGRGEPLSGGEIGAIKLAILVFFVAWVLSGYKLYREDGLGVSIGIGFCLAAIITLGLALVASAAGFLFSY